MLRHALALVLCVFGSCVKDGQSFLAGGMGLAGHSKGRATKVNAQRLMPGDACPRHGTGGISEEPDHNRPIISSSLGQTRATSHSRLLDVFGEVESVPAAATPPKGAAATASLGVEQQPPDESSESKPRVSSPSQEKGTPVPGSASRTCPAAEKEVEAADSMGKPSTGCDFAAFSTNAADIAAGGNELRAHPEQYEKINPAALHLDLSTEEINAVVTEHVRQMRERAEVLEQVLNGHTSFARRAQAEDPPLPNTTHGGFFGQRLPYTSRNAQERWEEEFYAKPVWKEEEKDEPATCAVGIAVNVNAAGCDVREGDDVEAASLRTSMYYPDGEQQGGGHASDEAPLPRKGGWLKRWWGGLRQKT